VFYEVSMLHGKPNKALEEAYDGMLKASTNFVPSTFIEPTNWIIATTNGTKKHVLNKTKLSLLLWYFHIKWGGMFHYQNMDKFQE